MKIGCNALYPYGPLTGESLFTLEATKEALRQLKEVGYDSVEYSHAARFNLGEAQALREHAAALGIAPWSIHAGGADGFGLGDTVKQAQASLIHCTEVCAAMGARVMVVHTVHCGPLRQPDEHTVEWRLDQDRRILEPVCTRAQDLGIDLGLENGATLVDMEYLLQLRELLGGPHVGFCIDTGHANLGDLGAARAIDLAGKWLYTTHLQDNHGQRDDHLPPGRGAIDWAAVFQAMRRTGYARPLMLELTDGPKDRPYDPDADLRQGLQSVARFAAEHLAAH